MSSIPLSLAVIRAIPFPVTVLFAIYNKGINLNISNT